MAKWFVIKKVPASKPLVGSTAEFAFHPSEVDQSVPGTCGDLLLKNKLSSRGVLSLVNLILKAIIFSKTYIETWMVKKSVELLSVDSATSSDCYKWAYYMLYM